METIFISYGHQIDSKLIDYDNIIRKIADDLRKTGYETFVDIDYLYSGSDWQQVLDEHIKASRIMLFMVSSRSVRSDGYCLNELCRAMETETRIIPILLDDSFVPLSINQLQRVDLRGCFDNDQHLVNDLYNKRFHAILGGIKGTFTERMDESLRLRQTLKPVEVSRRPFADCVKFCGRKNIMVEFERWLDSSDNSLFWICSDPGMGKTALVCRLSMDYPDRIAAIHFCVFNNSDKADVKKIICTLAYGLSEHIPEYRSKLLNMADIDEIYNKNPNRMFELLLVEMLNNIPVEKNYAIIIDALDEATYKCNETLHNDLCDILLDYHDNIPSWLKIVVTSRNEGNIRLMLNTISKRINLSNESNQNDLREYYRNELTEITEEELDFLVEKSESSFLFAREICKAIKNGNYSLDQRDSVPNGIFDLYLRTFRRLFPEEKDYKGVEPVLESIIASPEPIDINFLIKYLKMDERSVHKMVSRISAFFPLIDKTIFVTHKTITEWLTDVNLSGMYYISVAESKRKLLDFLNEEYNRKNYESLYMLKHYGPLLVYCKQWDRLYETLTNYEFHQKKVDLLALDLGLKGYLNEIEELYKQSEKMCFEVFGSEAFIRVFSDNRRLMYNSGLFFKLSNMGFSQFLKENNAEWGYEGEVGKFFYYYITEDFNRAIKKAKSILETYRDKKDVCKAEIYNVLGLSYRKIADFDKALDSFDMAVTEGDEYEELYEESLAHLGISKIKCRLLQEDEANRECRKAVKTLMRDIEDLPQVCDKRISHSLFLAEYYRVFADTMVWSKDLDSAQEYLQEANDIYTKCAFKDRYYIRFVYTSLFYNICRRNKGMSTSLLSQLKAYPKVGRYDVGQIQFLSALYMLVFQDVQDSDSVIQGLKNAYNSYDQIDAIIEREEVACLSRILQEKGMSEKMIKPDYEGNDYVEEWIDYVNEFIKNI